MFLNLKCPACGQSQRVSDEVRGTKVNCPSCGAAFRVSAPKAATQTPTQTASVPAPSAPAPSVAGPIEAPTRGGPAPWIYAVGGGVAVAAVIGVVIALRALVGSGAAMADYPDPSADIVLGVASTATPSPAASAAVPSPSLAVAPVAMNLAPVKTVAAAPVVTSPAPATSTSVAVAPAPAPAPGKPMTTAQIVAKWEPSVALVKGHGSSGTGFLVRPGILATNAHVIDEEFISSLEVQFPSAPEGKKGPFPAELLFEDRRRDLAFLRVGTDLPAIDVASSYAFTKGEDVTVIGNPGLGDDVVLENAISRGVMSSKTVIDGLRYLQLSIAINPGNSGGPVFDSTGRVIGVATLKASKAEAMAFCIPTEDLNAAIPGSGPPRPEIASSHRARVAFRLLTVAGALYGIGLEIRAIQLHKTPRGGKPNLLPNEGIKKLDELISALDEKALSGIDAEMAPIRSDNALTKVARGHYQDLAATYNSMKVLYANPNRPPDQYTSKVRDLRTKCTRLVESLQKDIKMEVPAQLLSLLKATVTDGQSQAVMAQMVPAPLQSRILRNRSRARSAAEAAHARMQDNRARMQDIRDRMHGRRSRAGR